ncbi:MAG: hypothetical protein AMJ55_05795 [Gammaproteobacteria bacterium SG8_15]|nr:MAG: hypothetical protein AMJ55_05795 [Gammaproteobacteria bacterium SG8_15]
MYTSTGNPKNASAKINEYIAVYSISNQPNMITPLNNQINIITAFGIFSGIIYISLYQYDKNIIAA